MTCKICGKELKPSEQYLNFKFAAKKEDYECFFSCEEHRLKDHIFTGHLAQKEEGNGNS